MSRLIPFDRVANLTDDPAPALGERVKLITDEGLVFATVRDDGYEVEQSEVAP